MSLSRKPSLQGRFQSALRFAVDPDLINSLSPAMTAILFQSASGFTVVPDPPSKRKDYAMWFQSASGFAVVPDLGLLRKPLG